jgi:excisionase family DNA binding protein
MKRDDNMDFRQLLFPWSPRYTVSTRRAAAMLQVSIWTVCRMIADGTLDAEKCSPDKRKSAWRVNLESVEKRMCGFTNTISAAQAADILDVSQAMISRMVKAGELVGYKIRNGGSKLRVSFDSVMVHLELLRSIASSTTTSSEVESSDRIA